MSSPYEYPNGNPGGFLNPKQQTRAAKVQKMKWNPANDCKLWPYIAGRDVAKFEWPIIAAQFPEGPSIKSLQERAVKLRAHQKAILARDGIFPLNKDVHPADLEESIASIEDISNADETPDPDDTDSTIGGGTLTLSVSANQAPRVTTNKLNDSGRKPIGGSAYKSKLNGRKPIGDFTSVNKRSHSSTINSDETINSNNSRSSTMPPPKRVRLNHPEPVESVQPVGRPIPNYDWLGEEGYKGLMWLNERARKEKAVKEVELKAFAKDNAEEFAAWKAKKLAEEVKAMEAKEANGQQGEPTVEAGVAGVGAATGGQGGGEGESDLVMHKIDGAGADRVGAGAEGDRVAVKDPEV